MVGSNSNKEESIVGFITNISNLENEYMSYFDNIPQELLSEKTKLMGIKQNSRYPSFNIKNENKKLGNLALDFINKVIEDIESNIEVKKRKGIDFSDIIDKVRDVKMDINSKKYNIGELMILYQEKFIQDIIEKFENKINISFYETKKFWFGSLFGFIVGLLTEYFGEVIHFIRSLF